MASPIILPPVCRADTPQEEPIRDDGGSCDRTMGEQSVSVATFVERAYSETFVKIESDVAQKEAQMRDEAVEMGSPANDQTHGGRSRVRSILPVEIASSTVVYV